jgi:hypothetical protein
MVRRCLMKRRIVGGAVGIAACVTLTAMTGSARVPQQAQPIAPVALYDDDDDVYLALDADGDGNADDRNRDGQPDTVIDVVYACAQQCSIRIQGVEPCFKTRFIKYFCEAAAAMKCAQDCNNRR